MCPPPSSSPGDPWAEDSEGDERVGGGNHGEELEREWRAREQHYFNVSSWLRFCRRVEGRRRRRRHRGPRRASLSLSRPPTPFPLSPQKKGKKRTSNQTPQHQQTGYRDGIEDGKARTVQHGFDEGFRAGAAAGFSAGAVRGALDALRLPGRSPRPAPAPAAAAAGGVASLESLAALFASAPKAQIAADLCSRLAAAPLSAEAVLGRRASAASGAAARGAARGAAGIGAREEANEVEARLAVSEDELRAALGRLDQVATAAAAAAAAARAGGGGGGGQSGGNGGGHETAGDRSDAPEALRLPEPLPGSADTHAMMGELRAALRERLGGVDVAEPPPLPA